MLQPSKHPHGPLLDPLQQLCPLHPITIQFKPHYYSISKSVASPLIILLIWGHWWPALDQLPVSSYTQLHVCMCCANCFVHKNGQTLVNYVFVSKIGLVMQGETGRGQVGCCGVGWQASDEVTTVITSAVSLALQLLPFLRSELHTLYQVLPLQSRFLYQCLHKTASWRSWIWEDPGMMTRRA